MSNNKRKPREQQKVFLPRKVRSKLHKDARAQGVEISQHVENLVVSFDPKDKSQKGAGA